MNLQIECKKSAQFVCKDTSVTLVFSYNFQKSRVGFTGMWGTEA